MLCLTSGLPASPACILELASCFPLQALVGEKEGFLTKARLGHYDSKRNDPNADAVSGLSGYFHFGQLAPQRAALEAGKHRKTSKVRIVPMLFPLESALLRFSHSV